MLSLWSTVYVFSRKYCLNPYREGMPKDRNSRMSLIMNFSNNKIITSWTMNANHFGNQGSEQNRLLMYRGLLVFGRQ